MKKRVNLPFRIRDQQIRYDYYLTLKHIMRIPANGRDQFWRGIGHGFMSVF